MRSRICLAFAAVALAAPFAFAQGLSAGTRLDPPARAQVEAPIAGTAVPLQSGRSVRRSRNVGSDGVSGEPSLDTPRICTNCDD